MANSVTVEVPASSTQHTITLQLEPRPLNWTDLAIYAPTFPGLLVAILGLWIAHRFTVARDRRKEILQLCEDTTSALMEAEAACVAAWLSSTEERANTIAITKSKLQAAGITATDLRRRTQKGLLRTLKHLFVDCAIAVDVVNDIGQLRDIATSDPFESTTRQPDDSQIGSITAKVAEIQAMIDLQVHELFG
jgi:hypothetical protein